MDSQLLVSLLIFFAVDVLRKDVALDAAFKSPILEILKVSCALKHGEKSLHLQCLW